MLCHNKPVFAYAKTDADQLRGNCKADQRLCFSYTDRTIPLVPKSEISSLPPSFVAVQPGLCRTWSETPRTGFVVTQHICFPPETVISHTTTNLFLHMRKQPVFAYAKTTCFCICENKDADQLRGNREADQRLCCYLHG